MSSATDINRLFVVAWCVLCACDGETATDPECFVGERSMEPEIQVLYRGASGDAVPIEPMSEVPLIQPPQGGKVMFIGTRARNMDGCSVVLSSALIDPASGEVISLERRPVLLEPDADGWLVPTQPPPDNRSPVNYTSNFSNLPACPRAGLDRPIEREVYELEVDLRDGDGRSATARVPVIPVCGEPARADLCRCECSKDFALGAGCKHGPSDVADGGAITGAKP